MYSVQNLVSISDFRSNLPAWLDKAVGQNPVVILQNSKPKAVVLDPEYLEYLEKYADGYYDAGDAAELDRAMAAGEDKHTIKFKPENYL
ncbi:MAG: type II toxin-antitoxin system Phd/YefM family antitoxin [Patescibacteria group bacterium]|nr:type II toxin-antitoxin system Phd/YefM family antitoxin [Patescibacteria group bacterium]